MRMHNPPYAEGVLRDYLGNSAGIATDVAWRISEALGAGAECGWDARLVLVVAGIETAPRQSAGLAMAATRARQHTSASGVCSLSTFIFAGITSVSYSPEAPASSSWSRPSLWHA